ncbi:HAMP domain-containing sensor histidine kinase [Acutalibacter caecimuris]|uniref:HAMP domain-containing sensor histidine kinase n=1 Tax=Acutalibacter caecimuris TaxID=3093657 RepID=UPI002AC8DC1D|nr:HAMP domain-containing sensor histidine kinase [Acutalibacter sp. M00118]
MGKLKDLSIKKTFCLIVVITGVVVMLLSTVSVRICSKVRDQILLPHAYIFQPSVVQPEGNGKFTLEASGGPENGEVSEFTEQEVMIFNTAQAMMVLLPVLFSFAGIACASSLFYRIKLKEPLDALKQGIVHIADNDLTYSIGYQKQDELGQLCGAFETMRRELLDNNRRMWAMVEERKKINASISHDLRTPITVIKGYSEYLDKNIGKDVLTEDGTREIAGYIHEAASRLEDYANSVHEVQALEDMSLDYKEIALPDLMKEMQTQLSILSEQHQTSIHLSADLPEQTVSLAPAAVFRIVENIVSNALRYCKSKISLDFSYSQPFLTITVTDDGKGFSAQDRAEALGCFYKGKKEKEHFGIGLTICKILAEKHGGSISLDNAPGGGAKVTVKLKMEEIFPL